MSRPIAAGFTNEGMSIEPTCWASVEKAGPFVAFTAVMHIPTKVIFFAPLQPEKGRTNTAFDYECMLCGAVVRPFLHVGSGNTVSTGSTGHEQCVGFVCEKIPSLAKDAPDGDPKTNFCGFALSFESEDGVVLSLTSRTLNPGVEGGDKGQLEPQIARHLAIYLSEKLAKIGKALQDKAAPPPAKYAIPDLQIMCRAFGKETGPDGSKLKWSDLSPAQKQECQANKAWNWTRPDEDWVKHRAEVLNRKPLGIMGAGLGAGIGGLKKAGSPGKSASSSAPGAVAAVSGPAQITGPVPLTGKPPL